MGPICRGPRAASRFLHALRLSLRYVEVWREDLRWHTMPEEVWGWSALPVDVSFYLMQSSDLFSFGLLYVINIRNELYFMLSCSVIDQRNYQYFEVCWFACAFPLAAFSLGEYRVVHNLVVTLEKTWVHDLNNFYISLYDSRVGAPERKIMTSFTYRQVDPRNPTCGLVLWV
jgi:hypothetical protein